MFVVTACLLILEIVVNTECTKPRSVNLALETVLSFDNSDISTDVKFLDDVQGFLSKVREVVAEDKRNSARRHLIEKNNIQFTHFVKYLINILKTYDNDDLEDIFAVIDDEIRKYHYKGCKFYELVENHNVRRFVANTLDSVKAKPATIIRKNIENALRIIEDAKYDRKQKEFLDYINSLYGYDSSKKLKKILDSLQVYSSKSKRANTDLIKLVRDSIRTVIFDHYSDLNANARRDFKLKLETFWKDLKNPENVNYNLWTMKYTDMQDRKQQTKKIRVYNKKARPNKHLRESNIKTDDTTHKPKKEIEKINLLNKYTHKDISRSNEDYTATKKSKHKKNKVKSKSNKRYKIEKTTKSDDVGSESDVSIESKISMDVSKVTARFDSSKKHKSPHKKTKHYKNKHKKSHDSIKSEKFEYDKNAKSSDISDDTSFIATKMRNSHRNQISTFITLYPEEIVHTTEKRRSIDEFATETSPQTIREKKVKNTPKEVTHLVSVHNAEINIEGLIPSLYDSESEKFRASDNEQKVKATRGKKRSKVEKKQRSDPKPKTHHRYKNFQATTEREQETFTRATTPKKERYDKPTYRTALSEEGLSIESYGIIQPHRTFRKSNDNDTMTNNDQLRQVNNTEKQLDDKNITTNLTEAYQTLKYWKGTTKTIENTTTTEITTENYSAHSNSTTIIHTNMTNVKVNTTKNQTEGVSETTTVKVISKDAKSEINRKKVIPLIDVRNNEIERDKDDINTFNEALENIFVKYNVTTPLGSTTKFDMKILNETAQGTKMKDNIIKDRTAQNLEEAFGEKRANITNPSVLADGYDDADMFKGLEDLDL